MKTKIIYISGGEVFEMADVRAAFDEVRTALGLGRDTVLFGVPVDNDHACTPASTSEPTDPVAAPASVQTIEEAPAPIITEPESPIVQEVTDPVPTPIPTEQIDTETIIETVTPAPAVVADVIEEDAPIVAETPKPVKKSRGRPRKTATPATVETAPEMPIAQEKVIPILSVLAANNVTSTADTDIAPAVADEIEEAPATEIVTEIEETIVSDADEIDDAPMDTELDIDDMIADQAPEEPIEQTLEQLLESMTPLREDHGEARAAHISDADISVSDAPEMMVGDDADATLEQLATEFADTADKIAAPAPVATQGKIGKLKNILPFKKARRDDTGLMGDLFGWAGVAANDEDFAMPGFFTTAAKK